MPALGWLMMTNSLIALHFRLGIGRCLVENRRVRGRERHECEPRFAVPINRSGFGVCLSDRLDGENGSDVERAWAAGDKCYTVCRWDFR